MKIEDANIKFTQDMYNVKEDLSPFIERDIFDSVNSTEALFRFMSNVVLKLVQWFIKPKIVLMVNTKK